MVDVIEDVKRRARALLHGVERGDAASLARLRALPTLAALDDGALAREVQLRHCLAALAHSLGFRGWPPARAALAGERVEDRGSVVFRESGGALWNVWFADYAEAREVRATHGGYLLAYRRQFLIAEAPFVRFVGLDPDDPDWQRIGRDWVEPADREAWSRLTRKAIAARLAT